MNSAWLKVPGTVAASQFSSVLYFQTTLPSTAPSGQGLVLPARAAATAASLPRMTLRLSWSERWEVEITRQFS